MRKIKEVLRLMLDCCGISERGISRSCQVSRSTVADYFRRAAAAKLTWTEASGVKTLYIELGSPWQNGYIVSFNGNLRDELLNRVIFTTLKEANKIRY